MKNIAVSFVPIYSVINVHRLHTSTVVKSVHMLKSKANKKQRNKEKLSSLGP